MKTIRLQYFAILREKRGQPEESRQTSASSPAELYDELKAEFHFPLAKHQLRVAINGEFSAMDASLSEGDEIVYIPPVAGG